MTEKTGKQTLRQQMVGLLTEGTYSARDLSKMLGIRERDVYDHLAHIARSVSPQKKRLITISCRCLQCGYTFSERRRLTRPSRCPCCRGERIQEPKFRVA